MALLCISVILPFIPVIIFRNNYITTYPALSKAVESISQQISVYVS